MSSRLLGRRTLTVGAAAGMASLAMPALAQGEPIKVGVIVPLSGPAGPNGQGVFHAVQVAAEMVNAKGGVMGRKIMVIAKDDESTPAVGVTRANEMVGEKVAVVIEGWNSPVTLAMQPVLRARRHPRHHGGVEGRPDPRRHGQSLRRPPQQLERAGRRGDRRHPRQPSRRQAHRLPHRERRLRQRRAGR